MVIVVRVLGLILCAMAVQFMLAGLAGSTINLVRRDTATPYQSVRPPPGPAVAPGAKPAAVRPEIGPGD
jgi:hypothetical protein